MLHISGRTDRLGTTHDGKSNLDYDAEEIRRGFTVSASIAPIQFGTYKINLVDTSGQPDFAGDTLAAMQACETAMFVIDAASGPEVNTDRLWREAEYLRLCRTIFINHIDREDADFDLAMATLHARYGSRLGAVTIPIGVGNDFKGIIDVLRMKARYYENGKERVEEIPAEFAESAELARDQLCDIVVEADDELMMKYLEGEPLTQEELESALGTAIAQEVFIPVFVGSTLVEQGIKNIMDDIVSYFPSPTGHGLFVTADGEEHAVSNEGSPIAFAFKTMADPFVGRLSFLKVSTGTLEPGMELVNARTGKKERLGKLYVMMGKETQEVKKALAGDIIVVPKLGETRTGDTLSASGDVEIIQRFQLKPQYPVVIVADNRNDEDKLGEFLARQADADPTIRITRNEDTHQTVVTTMGDMQVDLLLRRLKEQGNIAAHTVPVRIPYRETIRKTAEAQGRHKKQTGGAGQFGDCYLRLEPNPGAGYEFIDEIVGGKIPRNYIPAVDKGVQDAMTEGFLAGYPMVDIKCAVYDGSYHPVDSNEMAFKTAARIGFRAACEKASPVLLEPIVNVAITAPEQYAGAVMGDISTRRGRIVGTDSNDQGDTVILVRVPYAEVVTYTKDLRALTRGSGSYTFEFAGYEDAPMDVTKKLVEEYEASKNA